MKIRDENRIPKLLKELEYLGTHKLEIGILSGEQDAEVLMIASVHEFGVRITVTDAMRAYLNAIGIHLRADTTEINIPERSYIRAGFDKNVDDIHKTAETLLDGVLQGRTTARAMFEALGGQIVSKMQAFLIDLQDPPLHPATVERKGSSSPLTDTGQLQSSITWRVVRA